MPLAVGPALGEGKPRLDCLAEADLVGQQGALREGRRQREECYVHLMRVEVHPRRRQRLRQRILAQPLRRWVVKPYENVSETRGAVDDIVLGLAPPCQLPQVAQNSLASH